MLSNRYQKSECKNNYLHDYRQVAETDRGFLERCTRCGKQVHFPTDTPNDVYLAHHIRSALQTNDPLYTREYENG